MKKAADDAMVWVLGLCCRAGRWHMIVELVSFSASTGPLSREGQNHPRPKTHKTTIVLDNQ